jgi:Sulfotransferase family
MVLRNPDFKTTLEHYDQGVAQRNLLIESFTSEMIRSWQQRDPFHPDDSAIAFLGGHPRSGTTLLERVLDSHPQLTAFDEPDAFFRIVDPFLRRFGPDHPDLLKVSSDYRKHLLSELGGKCESRVWLDKNPSLTACLHSWLRVFPGLKVVIALRHPMDVMLSCFFLDSSMNSLSSNFLSLERISKHYRDMMDVWLRLRDLGGFDWMESRYEETVSDVATEGKRVTEFLGLEWQPEQTNFHQNKQETRVVAPTYHDVTKPVHQRSKQRWLKYESHLAPHMDMLEPYMKQLGYA